MASISSHWNRYFFGDQIHSLPMGKCANAFFLSTLAVVHDLTWSPNRTLFLYKCSLHVSLNPLNASTSDDPQVHTVARCQTQAISVRRYIEPTVLLLPTQSSRHTFPGSHGLSSTHIKGQRFWSTPLKHIHFLMLFPSPSQTLGKASEWDAALKSSQNSSIEQTCRAVAYWRRQWLFWPICLKGVTNVVSAAVLPVGGCERHLRIGIVILWKAFESRLRCRWVDVSPEDAEIHHLN